MFAPGKTFEHSLFLVGMARSLPQSGEVFHSGKLLDSCKHYTILEKLARDEHSSLLQKIVTYGCKKFYNIGPWGLYHKIYYSCNLRFL